MWWIVSTVHITRDMYVVDCEHSLYHKGYVCGGLWAQSVSQGICMWWIVSTVCITRDMYVVDCEHSPYHKGYVCGGLWAQSISQGICMWWIVSTVCITRDMYVVDCEHSLNHKGYVCSGLWAKMTYGGYDTLADILKVFCSPCVCSFCLAWFYGVMVVYGGGPKILLKIAWDPIFFYYISIICAFFSTLKNCV